LIAINACVRKKPDCLELERSRVTGKATSMAGQGPASPDWHFATTQGMLAALRASGL
jgi:hypothetical protein